MKPIICNYLKHLRSKIASMLYQLVIWSLRNKSAHLQIPPPTSLLLERINTAHFSENVTSK